MKKRRKYLNFYTFGTVVSAEKSKKRKRKKGRSLKTYENKYNKLKNFYEKIYKKSLKNKKTFETLPEEQKRKLKNKKFFCDKFPKFEDFYRYYQIKSPTKQ